MTEYEFRTKYVGTASTYIGMKGMTDENRAFCEIYNAALPEANKRFGTRTVKYIADNQMKPGWGWCGVFVSVIALICGYDFIPIEMGLGEYVNIAKRMGIWKNASYSPKGGDIVLYKWRDANGQPTSSNNFDHIEIVEGVQNGILKAIGGNNGGKPGVVSRRSIPLADPSIVGYVAPAYADELVGNTDNTETEDELDVERAEAALELLDSLKIGDTVEKVDADTFLVRYHEDFEIVI